MIKLRMGPKLIQLGLFVWLSAGCIPPAPVSRPHTGAAVFPTPPALPPEIFAVVQTVVANSPAQVGGVYPAPDQQWQAEVVIHPCVPVGEGQNAYEVLHLRRQGQQNPQVIDQQLITCGGLGAFGLAGLFWSPDSRYFYYTDAREGQPDGCGGFGAPPIRRVDTRSGQTQPLGNGTRSPDDTKIVTWQGSEFTVWAADGTVLSRQQLSNPNAPVNAYSWSPASQALVYLQLAAACPPTGPTTLIKFDLTTQQQTTLLTGNDNVYQQVHWDKPTELTLQAENNQSWRFDLTTNQLLPTP